MKTLAALEDAQSSRLELQVPCQWWQVLLLIVTDYLGHDVKVLLFFPLIFILCTDLLISYTPSYEWKVENINQ